MDLPWKSSLPGRMKRWFSTLRTTVLLFCFEVQRAVVQLRALQDNAYQDMVALMDQQVQWEDANQPTVEADGGIVNPEHTVNPSWL